MTVETLLKIADRFGVPTAFAAVLCIAIWLTGKWTANKVVEPLVNSHVHFLEVEQGHMGTIAGAVNEQTEYIKEIRDYTRENRDASVSIRDDQRKFPAVAEKMP